MSIHYKLTITPIIDKDEKSHTIDGIMLNKILSILSNVNESEPEPKSKPKSKSTKFTVSKSTGTDVISHDQITQIETGAGIFYYETSEENKVNSYGGLALAQIYSQKNSFNDLNVMLPMRLTLHGGAKINYSEKFSLSPNFIYMLQGNSFEFVPGVQSEYHLSNSVSLNTGINYRHLDAINALLGLRINKLSLGFSYDINVSDLNDYVKPVNSTEFSLKFITSRPEREKRETIKCPRL
jgi:hypothetical protein